MIWGAQAYIPGGISFLEPSCHLLGGWPNLAAVGRLPRWEEAGTPELDRPLDLCHLEGPRVSVLEKVLVFQGEGLAGMTRPDLSRKESFGPGNPETKGSPPGQRDQVALTCPTREFQKAGWGALGNDRGGGHRSEKKLRSPLQSPGTATPATPQGSLPEGSPTHHPHHGPSKGLFPLPIHWL